MILTRKIKERTDLAAIPRHLYSEAISNTFRTIHPHQIIHEYQIHDLYSHAIKKFASSFCFESYPTATLRSDVTHAKIHVRTYAEARVGGNHWQAIERISRKLYRRRIRGACAVVRSLTSSVRWDIRPPQNPRSRTGSRYVMPTTYRQYRCHDPLFNPITVNAVVCTLTLLQIRSSANIIIPRVIDNDVHK